MYSKTVNFKWTLLFFAFFSFLVKAKKTKTIEHNKKEICEKYKGFYINYVGKEVFFVTKKCKRRLAPKEEVDEKIKQGLKVLNVKADVIRAIPKAPVESKDSYKETYKKFEGQCIETSTTVYRVKNGGKRPYQSLAQARKDCSSIAHVDYNLLALLPDKRAMPLPKKLKKHEKEELSFIPPKELCKKMKIGEIYSFYSELFTLKQGKETCYLEEIETLTLKQRMKTDKNTPIELTPNEYLSLTKQKALKKSLKGNKS